jgi:hypothetical protein
MSGLIPPGSPDPSVDSAFLLHSRPGAPKVIYLDFTGHVTTGTGWNVKVRLRLRLRATVP